MKHWFIAILVASCSARTQEISTMAGAIASRASSEPTEALPALRSAPTVPARATGSSIVTDGRTVFIADEAHSAIFYGPLPSEETPKPDRSVKMPGRPAQIVRVGKNLLVTVRDPGMLAILEPKDDDWVIADRIALPFDTWGVATDGKTAVVTSAWSHAVSVIDLETKHVRATLDVAREPRGIVITGDHAYVSHLVGSSLTRIDGIASNPSAHVVDLPAAPLRTEKKKLDASLGWALAADGDRLYAARHALGAMGIDAWFGASTVDVMLLKNEEPLAVSAPKKQTKLKNTEEMTGFERVGKHLVEGEKPLLVADAPVVQPRDLVWSQSGLWILGEGNATVARLDAHSIAPSVHAKEKIVLDKECSGPTGIALVSEGSLLVHCAASFAIARIDDGKTKTAAYANDPLPDLAAKGRRAFIDANDQIVSGGLGCAGCHPEGRDDGHVWSLVESRQSQIVQPNDLAPRILVGNGEVVKAEGVPRQTPMLAGRVSHAGPYGWNGQAPDLESRIDEGLHLHRWHDTFAGDERLQTVAAIEAYLRAGLVAPVQKKTLGTLELRGKEIFESREAQCSMCHENGGSDLELHRVRLDPLPDYLSEDSTFRTPSLRFVSGTAPYFHDGSAATLQDVLRIADGRMGHTSHLSEADQRALVAYLSTL